MRRSLSFQRNFSRQSIISFLDEIKSSKKNIVLIGKVGIGKTTLLNRICDSKFETSDGGYSCTKQIQYNFTTKHDLVIIDFPGLKATRDAGLNLKTQITALKNLPIKMICLMIEYSTRDDDFERELSEMLGMFNDYKENIAIIITKCERINMTREENIKLTFKTGFKIENIIFSSFKKHSNRIINELNEIQKKMKNRDRISINTRNFAKNAPSLYNPDLEDVRTIYENDFNEVLSKFNESLDNATDNNLRKALYFCFKSYKENLLYQFKDSLKQKRIDGKEIDLNIIISEVLLFDNKMYDKFEEFKKKVESRIEIQINNYNGEYNKFKKCPHCGIIWFKVKGCDSMVCGRRTKIRDSICGRFKNYIVYFLSGIIKIIINEFDSCNYGEDNEFYGLTQEEIEKNKIREKEGKVKINPKGCGKSIYWNEMEDVSEKVLNLLKKEVNLDNDDYYNGFMKASDYNDDL